VTLISKTSAPGQVQALLCAKFHATVFIFCDVSFTVCDVFTTVRIVPSKEIECCEGQSGEAECGEREGQSGAAGSLHRGQPETKSSLTENIFFGGYLP
jgi:hypothetical protein